MIKNIYVHETACVDPGSKVGSGTRIWHFCHVMPGAIIGANCVLGQNVFVGGTAVIGNGVKIQNNVSVYDGITIEDNVFCGPSCVFTNVMNPRSFIERKHEYRSTLVKTGASIGANATIICGVVLGRYCFVGAGSVVTKDVPDFSIVRGVPARRCGWVCRCGVTLAADLSCPDCGLRYEHKEDGIVQKLVRE
jgi:UDP-2-acetamido-3-amino-2,3-dideoxy-glucuronate N-acetyltransferase